MPRKLHILTGAIYESDEPGIARVTTPDGTTGRFDAHGGWIDGALRQADPHLCLWVAGRQLPPGRAAGFRDLPLATNPQKESESA